MQYRQIPQFKTSAETLAQVREDLAEAHRISSEFMMLWNHASDQGDLNEMRRCWGELLKLRAAIKDLKQLEGTFDP